MTLASRDPQGGHIDRNENGEPTGILRETAQQAVLGVIPKPTHRLAPGRS
jgi:predicted amidohydrolase YtcJ